MTVGPAHLVSVGRIVRPHGLQGDVVVEPDTDFGQTRFRKGNTLHAVIGRQQTTLTIVASRPYDDRWVLRFAGHESIEAAEALRGVELQGALDPASLPANTHYLHDLLGCVVVTMAGDTVGEVTVVYTGAAQLVLGVAAAQGEVLVPLVGDICREVDVTTRRIVITPPDGLLDVNVPVNKDVTS